MVSSGNGDVGVTVVISESWAKWTRADSVGWSLAKMKEAGGGEGASLRQGRRSSSATSVRTREVIRFGSS